MNRYEIDRERERENERFLRQQHPLLVSIVTTIAASDSFGLRMFQLSDFIDNRAEVNTLVSQT